MFVWANVGWPFGGLTAFFWARPWEQNHHGRCHFLPTASQPPRAIHRHSKHHVSTPQYLAGVPRSLIGLIDLSRAVAFVVWRVCVLLQLSPCLCAHHHHASPSTPPAHQQQPKCLLYQCSSTPQLQLPSPEQRTSSAPKCHHVVCCCAQAPTHQWQHTSI